MTQDPPKITVDPDPPTEGGNVDVGRTDVTGPVTLKVKWIYPDREVEPIEVDIDQANPTKKIDVPNDGPFGYEITDCSGGAPKKSGSVTPA